MYKLSPHGNWKQRADALKANTLALYLASKDPRVPWTAKLVIVFVVAYALSPIDLVPDFIPVVGYLDDALLLPLGIWLAMRLIPREVWQDCNQRAAQQTITLPENRRAAVIIVLLWLAITMVLAWWLWALVNPA